MDQSGLSVKNLEPIIGKSNRVYEILNRKRPLTLAMIRRLHQSLGIPADALLVAFASKFHACDRPRECAIRRAAEIVALRTLFAPLKARAFPPRPGSALRTHRGMAERRGLDADRVMELALE